jgi:hypothetical protein
MIDYQHPDYTDIYESRRHKIAWLADQIRDNKEQALAMLRTYYTAHPWDFISDWGMTVDPRNIERGLSADVPFVLWPRQIEYVQWLYSRWQSGERGLCEKSRDCGVTWLFVGFGVCEWLFQPGFSMGIGSRKEQLVDHLGDLDSIFEKIRYFTLSLPSILLPEGFDPKKHLTYMRCVNPEIGSTITGEAGDEIGRGGRKSIYIVDEAAKIERQGLVDRALSATTNCQIDVGTPNGTGNAFYKKRMRMDKTDKLFIFDWRDDPRKDQSWYARQISEHDAVTVAQEIDRDYNASQEDSFIPAPWVSAAIDAHVTLGFGAEGVRVTAFDPADTGDARAVANRYGSIIKEAREKRDGDITQAIPWAVDIADEFRADKFIFDADGMGTPAMKLSLQRLSVGRMEVVGYHGSAGVVDPDLPARKRQTIQKAYREGDMSLESWGSTEKTNRDTYVNFRAQTWSYLRDRFEATYHAIQQVQNGARVLNVDPDHLISIDSRCKNITELQSELSRPKRIYTDNGKIKVESKDSMRRRGVESTNLADVVVMAYSVTAVAKSKKPSKPLPRTEPWGQSVPGVM